MIPGPFAYHRPTSVREAIGLLVDLGEEARPLAGGHSLIPMMKLRLAAPEHLVDLAGIPDLKGIRADGSDVVIGAMTTQHEIVGSDLLVAKIPLLREASLLVADPQVRYVGTLGGNLANASPAGDTLPVLLAYDAVVVTDRRSIPIDQFFTGYRKTALQPDELIVAVRLPLGRRVVFRKVGTRAAQAISKVVTAVSRSPARVAIGSVAEVPLRARRAEAALERGDMEGAIAAVADDIRPIDDVRSTAAYRRTVTQNVLRELLSVG